MALKRGLEHIAHAAVPLRQLAYEGFAPLVQAIGDAEVVMIGEASHGTEEFYRIRAAITQRLIEHHGFSFVAVEGDWPDVYRLNRYVQHGRAAAEDHSAKEALGDFERFPLWMWRNHAVADFAEWLKHHNSKIDNFKDRAGFYGLDLYSMYKSAQQVIEFLERVDPEAAKRARSRYGTIVQYKDDPHEYATAVLLGVTPSIEQSVIEMLVELQRKAPEYLSKSGMVDGEEVFYTQQNTVLVKDAEEYYRKSYAGGPLTWNIRDQHMHKTLIALLQHYKQMRGWQHPKAVVWAHNSHLGDARATYALSIGQLNIGQLVRQTFGLTNTFSIGFTTFNGSVRAATKWGRPGQVMQVNNALTDSYEALLHDAAEAKIQSKSQADADKERAEATESESDKDIVLLMRSNNADVRVDEKLLDVLTTTRLERAIGVQYIKDRERRAHYFDATLANQFDAVIHVDKSNALNSFD